MTSFVAKLSNCLGKRELPKLHTRVRFPSPAPTLFFAERSHHLVMQGPDQIGHHTARLRLDECFHRHSSHKLYAAETLDLLIRKSNADSIEAGIGLLVHDNVG